ncbi:MAG TPA: transposase [Dehalococcoidia bacterium]|jgi:hypothetical protein
MPQRTSPRTPQPALSPLVANLQTLLSAHRPAFRQERPYQRGVALVFASLFAFARHTLTQLLLTLGVTNDWSAWYRLFSTPRLDYDTLTACYLRETLAQIPADGPYVVGLDATQVPRTSRRMPGTGWLKAPGTPPWKVGIHRAQRFLHLAALLPRSASGYSRALPLRWLPAFPATAVPSRTGPRKEWEAARDALQWLRQQLDVAGRANQWLLAVGDGAYSTADLWASLPGRTSLLARCARNRALYQPPPPPPGRRGRPRRYGDRARTPAQWLAEQDGWQAAPVAVRGRTLPLRYRLEGPFLVRRAPRQPLFLLVVRGVAQARRWRRREPSFFLVSARPAGAGWALPVPAAELLAWAWQRWELEVAHREVKTGLGLGEIQSWNATATELATQWQASVYAVLLLAGIRTWGLTDSPLRPPGRWWGGAGRWSLATLWRGYRQALWGSGELRALCTATGADWWTKADQFASLANAVAAAQRA